MTAARLRRTWPTLLFVAAATWFAVALLLPVADQAWRAVAVTVPFEPSLDAEAAHLLADAEIVVRFGGMDELSAATFGRGLSAAIHPLRLDIIFDPQQAGETLLVATEALSRGLGPRCLLKAIEPLVGREAAGGDRTYLASLGMEVIQAAYEADRFGKPLLSHWLTLGIAVLCGAFAAFSHRLGHVAPPPVPFYMPSMGLVETRRRLESRLARIQDDIATTQASLAEREAAVADPTEPTWWERLNLLRRIKDRREAARARIKTTALAAKLAVLQNARSAVEAEMSRNERRLSQGRRRFNEWIEDRAWLAKFSRQAVGILAIAASILATTHATLAFTHPGALISSSRFDEMLFRSDTLIATALEANPDLVAAINAHCFARVIQPEPQEAVVSNAAEQPQGEAPSGSASAPLRPSLRDVRYCQIGIPCGQACIPTGRVCRIGQVARIGQECGKGYISMAKTCHVDHTLPPVTPIIAKPAATAAPFSGTSTSAYPRLDDAPQYVSPPPSTDVVGNGVASTPLRTIIPAPAGQPSNPPRTVHVDGYTRSNGTQVQAYDRAAPGQGTGRGSRK